MTNILPDDFKTDPGFDAAEDHVGPFYYRETSDGYESAFMPEEKNCNVNGLVHGGILMTFADFALCLAATDHYQEESCSTVSFSADFVAAASRGEIITCTPSITRKTGSLVFVTGTLVADSTAVMTFSAVVKRLRSQ